MKNFFEWVKSLFRRAPAIPKHYTVPEQFTVPRHYTVPEQFTVPRK